MRQKFLNEHTHKDDEARFFVDGSGLFYINTGSEIIGLLCTKGDLVNVPAGTRHWFDMGAKPFFQCVRVFTDPAGWVGHFTGSLLASQFPLRDEYPAFAG
jgi:1,2-dihydroxy-3-keto-5-methylthiopentene dioxygenase